MNILNKLAIKNLKLNKKRSIGTIIGIILSTALICAVAGMGTSLQASLVHHTIEETGYYHLKVENVNENKIDEIKSNRDVKDIIKVYNLGSQEMLIDNENAEINIYSLNIKDFENLSYKLSKGHLPENENEIVLSKKIMLNSNIALGDNITLNNRDYKVVGTIEKGRKDTNFYGLTINQTSSNIDGYISLKNVYDYESIIPQILEVSNYRDVMRYESSTNEFTYKVNNELIRWETFSFSDTTVKMIYSVVSIVIIVILISSIFCIKNSFAISTQEKKKMYGMLVSIGATKKQIKKAVLSEAFLLGIIGIPLGILLGVLAVAILVVLSNIIAGDIILDTGIQFKVTMLPIIISIILAAITIYFSALGSAKRISKISPIEQLRSQDDIKIPKEDLKNPRIIKKIFGIGGEIAYKNLKRNKQKYKTTIISLTISILLFIVMSTFVLEAQKFSSFYYTEYDYNIVVDNLKDENESIISKIKNLPNTKKSYIAYLSKGEFIIEDRSVLTEVASDMAYGSMMVIALDDETFQEYTKKLKINYEKSKDNGILIDEFMVSKNGKEFAERAYNYSEKDIIQGKVQDKNMEIEICKITNVKPYGYENYHYDGGFLIVNYDVYKNKIDFMLDTISIMSTDHEQTVKDIETLTNDPSIYDKEQEEADEKAWYLLINIFLYGFIFVITLIGVTNIFNTITSNMELRQKEFAMLKSIGMTKKEFNRMINLETIFYSIKSLIYGVILGIIGGILVHMAFGIKVNNPYTFPLKEIVIAIVFVFVFIFIIMRYSIKKINKQNIIETIRKENI